VHEWEDHINRNLCVCLAFSLYDTIAASLSSNDSCNDLRRVRSASASCRIFGSAASLVATRLLLSASSDSLRSAASAALCCASCALVRKM
jgi:hypothetical protein